MDDTFDKFMEQDMILDDLDIDSTHEHMDKPEDILNFYDPTSKKRNVNSVDVGESSYRDKPDVANGQQPGPILNRNDDEPSTSGANDIIPFQPTVSPTHQDDQRVSQDVEQGVVEDAFESRGRRDHRCGESFCSQCSKYYMGSPLCYIPPTISTSVCVKLIFFDFETVQETGTHVPNYCKVHKVCDKCEELDDCTSPCPEGHQRKIIFNG